MTTILIIRALKHITSTSTISTSTLGSCIVVKMNPYLHYLNKPEYSIEMDSGLIEQLISTVTCQYVLTK